MTPLDPPARRSSLLEEFQVIEKLSPKEKVDSASGIVPLCSLRYITVTEGKVLLLPGSKKLNKLHHCL